MSAALFVLGCWALTGLGYSTWRAIRACRIPGPGRALQPGLTQVEYDWNQRFPYDQIG